MTPKRPHGTILIVRYSDAHAPPEGTLIAHQAVVDRFGYVWFGKFGRRIGPPTLQRMRQFAMGIAPAGVVLVTTSGAEYVCTYCRLLDAGFAVPEDEASAVPDYYRRYPIPPSTWLKLSRFRSLSPAQADRITLFEAHVPLSEGLRKSWSGHFLADGDPETFLA
jgi:hypothetical protein